MRTGAPGPQRWAPLSPGQLAGRGRVGGRRQRCSSTAGSLPCPLPPSPAPRSEAGTLAAAGHGSAVRLENAGRTPRAPSRSPPETGSGRECPGHKFPPPVSENWTQPGGQTQSQRLLPTSRVAVTRTRKRAQAKRVWGNQSPGAHWGWQRECASVPREGARKTVQMATFTSLCFTATFFYVFFKKSPDVSSRPSLRTRLRTHTHACLPG